MKNLSRKTSSVLFLAPLVVFGLVLTIGARGPKAPQPTRHSVLPNSPLSGGVLMAQAVHDGRIVPVGGAPSHSRVRDILTCGIPPCALPNTQASEGGFPVNEDPIVANPANHAQLLTGGNDFNCPGVQGFYGSDNGGTNWLHSCLPVITGGFGNGDPTVGYSTDGTTAYAGGIQTDSSGSLDVVVATSTNNGSTWNTPVIAVTPFFTGGLDDKDWMEVDNTPTSPFTNTIYVENTQFDSSSDSLITVSHSTDGGMTFTTVKVDDIQLFPGGVDQFGDLAIGKDGTVYVTWMRCPATGPAGNCGDTNARMMFSKSTDGGNTWSEPVVMAFAHLAPDSCNAFYGCVPNVPERLSNIPVIDVDRSSGLNSGQLYVAFYSFNVSTGQTQVQVITSKDGGVVWRKPLKVSPASTPGNQFFQWLTVNPTSGSVGVSWLDTRNDPLNTSYEAFAAVSVNGLMTFQSNVTLTTSPSNPFHDGFGGTFMGDYTGNFWQANRLFVSWMDTSNGVNAQDQVGGVLLPKH